MEAESVKLLGVTFSAGWNFDKHIQNLVARCNFRIANLAKIKPYITVKQLSQLGEALVMSVVRYGLEFLAASEANLTKLQGIQNRLMRMVTSSDRSERIANMILRLKWTSVRNLARLQLLTGLYRVIRTGVCRLQLRLITMADETNQTRYTMRSRDLRLAWQPRLSRIGGQAIIIRAVETWNSLQLNGTMLPNGKKTRAELFKKSIKEKYGMSHKNKNV